MKRISAMLLSFVMILAVVTGMTACQDEKTVYQLYTEAQEKNANLDSIDATIEMQMKMDMSGTSMEIPMKYWVRASGLTGDKPVMRIDMDIEMMGADMKYDIYSADGWNYYTTEEGNYKIKSLEDETIDTATLLNNAATLTEEQLKDIVMTEKDGVSTFELTLSGEQLLASYKDLAEGMAEGMAVSAENIRDAKVTVSLKDGYVLSEGVTFAMTLTEESVGEVTIEVVMNATYQNLGTAVTVQAPNGYEEYEEYSFDWGF